MKTRIILAAAAAVALSAGAAQAQSSGSIGLSGTQAAACQARWNGANNPLPNLNLFSTTNQGLSSWSVQCNRPYTRTISSANNGFLVGPGGTQIDYEFGIGGGGLTNTGGLRDLNTPFVQNLGQPSGTQTGSVTARIKDVVTSGSIPAGDYTDVVTISVAPN